MVIYKKTAKGMNELMARRSGIDSHLNSMLLLVDGKRNASEINRLGVLVKMPADALEMLVHGGYIEAVEVDMPNADAVQDTFASIVHKKPSANPDPAPGQPQESVAFADKLSQVDAFRSLYSSLVNKTRTLLGLRGLRYQLRLEHARTFDNLTALIAPLGEAVAKRHGLEAGMNFVRDCDIVVNVRLSSMRASQFSESEMGITLPQAESGVQAR